MYKNPVDVIRARMKRRGTPVYVIANATGIEYYRVYKSLSKGYNRPLLASEFIAICDFLELTIADFIETEINKEI